VARTWEDLFAFIQSCGRAFLPSYLPIVKRRQGMEYGDRERNFQLYRRGRYVEFARALGVRLPESLCYSLIISVPSVTGDCKTGRCH